MKKLLTITLALICVVLMAACGTKTIKIEKYIDVEYTSEYNGYARPELIIDEEGLNSYIDAKKVAKLLEKMLKDAGEYEDVKEEFDEMIREYSDELTKFSKFFDINFAESYRNLSNKDKIVVNISLNEDVADMFNTTSEELVKELGIKLSKNKLEFKVKGLEKLKTIKLDTDQLLKADFGKYDGYGTPTIEIDTNYLRKATIVDFVKGYTDSLSDYTVKNLIAEDYKWFDVELDKAYSNLSNGDKVKVNIVINKELEEKGVTLEDLELGLGIELKDKIKTFKVSGLEEPKNVIDVFENIEQYIVYDGGNGYGRIRSIEIPEDYTKVVDDLHFSRAHSVYADSLKVVHNNTRIADINFEFDYNLKDLSKGDTVEITFFGDTQELEKLGYIIPSNKTNITVPDLGTYLTSKDQIKPEVIEALKAEINSQRSPKEICEIYYATYNPGIECGHNSTSFIVPIIYKSGWFGGYFVDEVYDVIIKPDGSVETDYGYSSWGSYDTLEEAKANLDTSKYSFELIEGSDAEIA